MDIIFQWVMQYGYAALFALMMFGIIGLPIPDETILTFAGYLVSQHILQLHFTLPTVFLGSVSGITVSYELGKRLGLPFLHKYGSKFSLTEEKLDKVQIWYDRIDAWILVLGYFIPGVRHFSAFLAGVSGLRYRTFALYAYSGALIWSATFVFLGLFVGAEWKIVAEQVRTHILLGVGVLLLFVAAAVIVRVVINIYKKR